MSAEQPVRREHTRESQLTPTARSATLSGERTLPASAARMLAIAASTRSTPAASHGGGQREALRSSNGNSDRRLTRSGRYDLTLAAHGAHPDRPQPAEALS